MFVKDIEGKVYLLFDEIQLVDEWEESINSYRVSFDCDIYITGSNSKLLSNELATLLAGRYIKINLYPFSFKEVLQYRKEIDNIELNKELIKEYLKEIDKIPERVWRNQPVSVIDYQCITGNNADRIVKAAIRTLG